MSQCPCAVLVPLGKLVSSQLRKGQEEWKIPKRCASPSSAPVCGTVTREPCIPMRFPSFPVPELQLRTQAAAQRMGWRWRKPGVQRRRWGDVGTTRHTYSQCSPKEHQGQNIDSRGPPSLSNGSPEAEPGNRLPTHCSPLCAPWIWQVRQRSVVTHR